MNTVSLDGDNCDCDAIYSRAFTRHRGLINEEEQRKLKNTCVAIPGMGGLGGLYGATLARTGIGRFSIADFDQFEVHNINRQYGAMASTIGKDKVKVMHDIIADISPAAEIRMMNEPVGTDNIDRFLEGVDIVVDAMDVFSQTARRIVFSNARNKGIPVFSAAPLGFSAVMFNFHPEGMSYDEFAGLKDGMTEKQMALHFICAIGAQGPHLKYMDTKGVGAEEGAAPSLGMACQIGAGMVATEITSYILGRREPKWIPHFSQFDPNDRSYKQRHRRWGAKNPVQRLRMQVLKRRVPEMNE
jgi:molybdopterin/thiamine biosynthesis adenylyltransferase